MKKLCLMILVLILCLPPIFSCAGGEQDPQKEKIFAQLAQEIRYGIVEVRGRDTTGSGIITHIGEDFVIIVTNHHVTEDYAQVTVRFFEEDSSFEGHSAFIMGRDAAYDICVLKVNHVPQNKKALAFKSGGQMGESVAALGYNGGQLAMFGGIVSTPDKLIYNSFQQANLYVLCTDAPFISGCSGGAIINNQGEVLALSSYSLKIYSGSTITETGATYGIPAAIVSAVYGRVLAAHEENPTESARIATPFIILNNGNVFFGSGDNEMTFRFMGGYIEVVEGGKTANAKYQAGMKLYKVNGKKIGHSISLLFAELYQSHIATQFSA